MCNMMRSFSEPLGRDLLSISDGRRRTHNGRDHDDACRCQPFSDNESDDGKYAKWYTGVTEKLWPTFNGSKWAFILFFLCYDLFQVGDESPKVFQASTQTRRAPEGVKETRKAMRDSDSGLERMAVGHHIHDRGYVIRKSKNNKTGDEEVNQEFINMNESDAYALDDEWQNEVLKYKPIGRSGNTGMLSVCHEHSGSRELKRREKIHRSPDIKSGRRSNIIVDKLSVKGSPVKITKK